MLNDYLFETPWWLPTVVVVIGAYLFIHGNRRQEKRILYAGIVVALLGVAIALISYFVQTDKEKAVGRTRELIVSADRRDWTKFRSLIDPGTTVFAFRGPDAITVAAKAAVERFDAHARITGMDVDETQTLINVTVRVLGDSAQGSILTDWQFQYQDLGHGFELYSVKPLPNQQITEDRIRSEVSQGK